MQTKFLICKNNAIIRVDVLKSMRAALRVYIRKDIDCWSKLEPISINKSRKAALATKNNIARKIVFIFCSLWLAYRLAKRRERSEPLVERNGANSSRLLSISSQPYRKVHET